MPLTSAQEMEKRETRYIECSDGLVRRRLEGLLSKEARKHRKLTELIRRQDGTWLFRMEFDHLAEIMANVEKKKGEQR